MPVGMTIKCIIVYLLFSVSAFYIRAQNLEHTVSLEYQKESLRAVLEAISKQTGTEFVYRDDVISDVSISCKINGESTDKSLNKIMDQANIEYKKYGNTSYILLGKRKPKVKKVRTIMLEDKSLDTDTIYSVSKPKLLSKKELTYPAEAVKNNISGDVRLRMCINTSGEVIESLIESSSGSNLLDSVSIDFSRNLKFTPALANGKPRRVWITMRFEFNIIDVQ